MSCVLWKATNPCIFLCLFPFNSLLFSIFKYLLFIFLNLPFFPPSISLFYCTPFWFPFPFTCINSTTWCSSCSFFFSPTFLGIFPGGVDLYGIWLFFFVDFTIWPSCTWFLLFHTSTLHPLSGYSRTLIALLASSFLSRIPLAGSASL